jgi:hypothetical protein
MKDLILGALMGLFIAVVIFGTSYLAHGYPI